MVKLCVVFVCVWAALEYLECCFARSSHGVVPMPKTWWRVKKRDSDLDLTGSTGMINPK